MTRRGVAVGVLVAAGVVAVVVGRRCQTSSRPAARRAPPVRAVPALDLARLKAQLVRHRATAQALAARRAGAPGAATPRRGAPFTRMLLEPRCILGPADLCALLADSAEACADGDARACLAIGQYLGDTPPRPLVAVAYFAAGCKLGDAEACARAAPPAADDVIDCDVDLLRCGIQARQAGDLVKLDEVCARGVADACALLSLEYADEPARAHAYTAMGCQLGNPMLCQELGRRLSPGCTGTCDPPDAAAAAIAHEMACAAGFEEACAALGLTDAQPR